MSQNDLFSYTNRSLETSRAEGMNKIPIISKGDWTDLNPTDPGMIILDYVHALVDMIQYYQDHNALETFISTAKERKNIFRIAEQLSYNIPSAKGAKVDVEFYVKEAYNNTIYIPKHTVVYTSSNIKFLTLEDAYIPGGGDISTVTVPCVQGEVAIEYYTGTGISRYSNVENAENQVCQLQHSNIDIDTIEVIEDSAYIWTPVDRIIFSDPNEKVYQKKLRPDGLIEILFGDGVRGFIPREEDTLVIQYIYSLAEKGRTGAETITNIEGTIYDLEGNPVTIFVHNIESTSGGSEPLSDEEIVEYAPGAIKAQNRAVTLSDFEHLAKLVDGVADAKAYDINTDSNIPYHVVKVLIIPDEGSEFNTSLHKSVYDFLYERMIPPTNLQVASPEATVIDIDLSIVANPSYIEGGIEHDIQLKIKEYFRERSNAIGQSFNPYEVVSLVSKVPGVRYVDKITPSDTISVSNTALVKLNKINISIIR